MKQQSDESDQPNSTHLLSEMINMVPGVVYQFYARPNGEMGFYYISPSSERIIGLKPELAGYLDRFAALIIPELRAGFIKSIELSVKAFSEWKFEGVLQKPSGEKIWFSGHSTPSLRADEIVFNGIVQDITERKRALKFLQTVVNNIPDYVFWKDRQSVYLGCNNAFAKVAGVGSQENIIGKTDYDLKWKKEESDFFVATDRAVMETDKAQYHIIEPQLQADGKQAWLETCKVPLHDEQGQVIGILGTYMDITERKHTDESLSKVQKLEALGVLAGGIAHDFNNILTIVFGFIELANMESKDEQVKAFLAKSLSAVERARALTGQLLTFAKGGAPVRKKKSLLPFLHETVQFALSGANVAPRFDLDKNLWAANYDQNQIGQTIDNIVINAQQSMPMGGTIEITARNVVLADKEHLTLPNGRYVRISIKDYGTGIPKEHLPRIFDPFFTTKNKGHGLGLATCYSIIRQHQGCIDVDSELGNGSTFHIYLPAVGDVDATTLTNPTITGKGIGTFLVMDDEECIQEVTKVMLESLGYTVVCRTEGKSAVAFVAGEVSAHRTIAGIILDLTIPGGMGGEEAVKKIRELCPTVPVFVVSGYAQDPIMANPQAYGFAASISKPFKMDDLAAMLSRYSIAPG